MTFDVLATYLVHPGSALYIGFTDRYDDLSLDPDAPLALRLRGRIPTSRQVFVKVSRALRY